MPFKFNPFSGNFDQTGSGGGGGASYIDGEVATYNDLPLDGTAALNSAWLVREASGTWLLGRKPAGIYIRTATAGSSRDADYTYAGILPDVFSDANFTLYDDSDSTKTAKFQLSGISTNTTRTLTVPNASGRIQVEGQPIGNTTPSTGTFTTLSASGAITAAAGTAGTPTTLAAALGLQWSGLGGSDLAAVYGTYAGAGKVGIGVGTSGIITEVASFALGGIALNRSVAANNGTLTASAPVLDLSQTWNNAAVTFTGLRLNITDTASAAASNLLEIQVGGVTRMMLKKSGTLHLGQFTNSGFYTPAPAWHGSTAGLLAATNLAIGSSLDTILERGGAGILEQRNLANAQTYRIYNTTDAGLTNFERGFMRWSSNVLQIGTEKGGTGSARALEFQTDGATRFTLAAANTATFAGGLALQWGGGGTRIIGATFPSNLLQLQTASTDRLVINDTLVAFGSATNAFPALKRSSTTLQVRLADDSAYSVLDAQLRAQGTAPASSGATGTAGDIRYDADYIYICTAANTWKRAAIATW